MTGAGKALISMICLFGLSACTSAAKNQADSANQMDDLTIGQKADDGVNPDLASEELSGTSALPAAPSRPHVETAALPVLASNASSKSSFNPGDVSEVDVTDLKYLAQKGGGTVVIETSGPATFRTREEANLNQVVIEIANAKLPAQLKRPLITKDFKQSIASINAYQDPGVSTARVVIQFRGAQKAVVQQNGRSLFINALGEGAGSLAKSKGEEASANAEAMSVAQNDVPVTEDEKFVDDAAKAGPVNDKPGTQGQVLSASLDQLNNSNVKFYGRPISIEVRDLNVKDVLSLIAEQSGANLVVSDKVDGNITLKLRDIPWDQALLLVMRSKQLGYVRQGTVLRIAPMSMLQSETEEAKKVLDAQRAAEPLKVKVIPVSYAKVTDLKLQVDPFLSTRGKAVGDTRTSSIVVTDIAEVLDRVTNLIRALDTPPLQVLIEGKVVEARETFARSFGFNWGYSPVAPISLGSANLTHNVAINGGGISAGGGSSGGTGGAATTPSTIPLQIGMSVGVLDFFGNVNANLALSEHEDLVKVISSPQITTMNNEPASIVQQTTVYINQVLNNAAGTQITPQPQAVELRLEVTPQITSDSDVIMQMLLKRQFAGTASSNGGPSPINTREAKTKVLVKNGQTAVIGGIYQSDNLQSEDGIPGLRTIPIVGWLFKNHSHTSEKNELLLFLTPRILNPDKATREETL